MLRDFLARLRQSLRPQAGKAAPPDSAVDTTTSPTPLDPRQVPSGVLAYVGDAVYELYVRTHLLQTGVRMPGLHRSATRLVNAVTQAQLYRALEPELTDEERSIARRGRNSTGGQVPRSASVSQYRHATGLECLFGYLLLAGDDERLLELLRRAIELASAPAE